MKFIREHPEKTAEGFGTDAKNTFLSSFSCLHHFRYNDFLIISAQFEKNMFFAAADQIEEGDAAA